MSVSPPSAAQDRDGAPLVVVGGGHAGVESAIAGSVSMVDRTSIALGHRVDPIKLANADVPVRDAVV